MESWRLVKGELHSTHLDIPTQDHLHVALDLVSVSRLRSLR